MPVHPLTEAAVAPLLALACDDPDPRVRETAWQALAVLPLTDAARQVVGAAVLPALSPDAGTGQDPAVRDAIVRAAAALPLAPVRAALRKVAAREGDPARLTACMQLAALGEQSALPGLVDALAIPEHTEEASRVLATFPYDAATTRQLRPTLARRLSAMDWPEPAHLLLATAVHRLGGHDLLDADAVREELEGFVTQWSLSGRLAVEWDHDAVPDDLGEALDLFARGLTPEPIVHGEPPPDPPTDFGDIAARTLDFADPLDPDLPDDHPQRRFRAALTALRDAPLDGARIQEAAQAMVAALLDDPIAFHAGLLWNAHELLAVLPAWQARELPARYLAAWHHAELTREAAFLEPDELPTLSGFNNELVELVSSLPPDVAPDAAALWDAAQPHLALTGWSEALRTQLAWAQSRAGLGPMLTALRPWLSSDDADARRLAAAQLQLAAPVASWRIGPMYGGEPSIDSGPNQRDLDDPPRRAYADLTCPDRVVATEPFELRLGLSPSPVQGVVGGALQRPDDSVGDYLLDVHLVADGFQLRKGESWTQRLPVTADAPWPHVLLHLSAQDDPTLSPARVLHATFSVDGQAIGSASRAVLVVDDGDLDALPATRRRAATPPALGEPQGPPVDVEIVLRVDNRRDPGLIWELHESGRPGAPRQLRGPALGDAATGLPRQLIDGVARRRGSPGLGPWLRAFGRRIADKVPEQIWQALRDARARRDAPPTVLLFSEEPLVPWELAVVALDGEEDFLATQAVIGRWPLGRGAPRPPTTAPLGDMAVVSGDYSGIPGLKPLPGALAEAADLRARWQATDVAALSVPVFDLLAGQPPARVLHFALHGHYDPGSGIDGLILADRTVIEPLDIEGGDLSPQCPVVFLNACEVGAGAAMLGSPAGLAAAFVTAHATAVVAPLWRIPDGAARDFATRFYEGVAAGQPPAELLRAERAAAAGDASLAATVLAFQLHGHPGLRLVGPWKPPASRTSATLP